jgi:hypothetical protein
MALWPGLIRAQFVTSQGQSCDMQARSVRLTFTTLLLLVAGNAFSCEQCGREGVLSPDGIGWQQLELHARKFLVKATTIVDWSVLDIEAADVDWMNSDGIDGVEGAPLEPNDPLLHLVYSSDFLGRHIDTSLWMDPRDGAIFQYSNVDTKKRARRRIYRFTNRGAFQRTWTPGKKEKKLAWTEWTDNYADFRPFPPEVYDEIITDSLGIIYILPASGLGRGGDQIEMLAFGSREVSRGILTAGEIVDLDADLVIQGPSGEMRCKGTMKVLKIHLDVEPVGHAVEADSGVLSEIEILMDIESRLPLRISARAKYVGRVVIKTTRARMIDDRGCPASLESQSS